MRTLVFLILFLPLGCAPEVDDPKTFATSTFTVQFPSNWSADETANGGVFIEERLFLGQIAGSTFVRIVPHTVIPMKMEQAREVEATISGVRYKGTLGFDWDKEEAFVETFCLDEGAPNEVCIETGSDKLSIERARPGIDLIYKTFERTSK